MRRECEGVDEYSDGEEFWNIAVAVRCPTNLPMYSWAEDCWCGFATGKSSKEYWNGYREDCNDG